MEYDEYGASTVCFPQNGSEGSLDAKKDTGEEYVEDNGQALGHIIERKLRVFKTQIVGNNHPHYENTSHHSDQYHPCETTHLW